MFRVALTGGIATGKSYVRSRVAARGVPTIDADAVVHALFAPGTGVVAEVARRFGAGMLAPDGSVNRRALGGLVFSDGASRRDLETIVHPAVYARIAEWTAACARDGAAWVLADIPLLYETGREGDFDRVVVAACSPEEQLRRVVRRDRLTEAEAHARIGAQRPIGEKARMADYVVDTSGPFDETDRRVEAVCRSLDRAAGGSRAG